MKISLVNLLLLVTIAGLIAALVVATRTKTTQINFDLHNKWDVPNLQLEQSKWIDKTQQPELTQPEVFQIVESVSSGLNSKPVDGDSNKGNATNWRIIRMSLVLIYPFHSDNHWAYVVTLERTTMDGWDSSRGGMATIETVTLLVLMTGEVVFDSDKNSFEFSEIQPFVGDAVTHAQAQPNRSSGTDVNEQPFDATNPFRND